MNFLKNEDGQGLTEYVLIAVLVSICAVALLSSIGNSILARFVELDNKMP